MHLKVSYFSYSSIKTCVLGAQKNRLIETVLEYPQHMFRLRNKKNNFQYALLSGGLKLYLF